MKVTQSTITDQIIETYQLAIGDLYFLNNNIVISEIKESIHVTFENSQEFIEIIKQRIKPTEPFGLISNMTNSYSVNLTDAAKFREELKNLSAYVMVSYNQAGKLNAEVASNYCRVNNISFADLYSALSEVKYKVKQSRALLINKSA